MKTLGILGGISPQATMAFEAALHRAAQRLVPQRANSGYPPLLVYYHRRPPIMTTDGLLHPALPLRPDPDLLEAARWLGSRADALLIVSNSMHALQAPLEAASGLPLLSMVEPALAEVRRRGWQRVGVLGFPTPGVPVYSGPLEALGLVPVQLDGDTQQRLNADILGLMEGRPGQGAAQDAVAALRAQGVDGIVLGCTEIPLLLGAEISSPDLLDPLPLFAEAAVRFALAGLDATDSVQAGAPARTGAAPSLLTHRVPDA